MSGGRQPGRAPATQEPATQEPVRQAPDGQPAPRRRDTEGTNRSRVSEVQDPVIAGDADSKTVNAGDVTVDEAGQVRPKKESPDLLH